MRRLITGRMCAVHSEARGECKFTRASRRPAYRRPLLKVHQNGRDAPPSTQAYLVLALQAALQACCKVRQYHPRLKFDQPCPNYRLLRRQDYVPRVGIRAEGVSLCHSLDVFEDAALGTFLSMKNLDFRSLRKGRSA